MALVLSTVSTGKFRLILTDHVCTLTYSTNWFDACEGRECIDDTPSYTPACARYALFIDASVSREKICTFNGPISDAKMLSIRRECDYVTVHGRLTRKGSNIELAALDVR